MNRFSAPDVTMNLPREPAYRSLGQADLDEIDGRMSPTPPSSRSAKHKTSKDEGQASQRSTNHEVSIRRKPVPSVNTESLISPASAKEQGNIKNSSTLSTWWSTKLFLLDNWWFWEIFGLMGSGLTLVAIAVLLSRYDLELRPSWKQVSLNTVVSWLSTLSRLLIFIPLSSGIGQLKWIWFADKTRELTDLNVFDSASRGMLGSVNLLWTTRGRHIAGIGAIATILAVAFDPFNQALVHYYQENIQSSNYAALLTNASIFDSYGSLVGGSQYSLDPVLKANIYNSIFNPNAYQSWGVPEYVCNSGNCTWGPFASLEARSLCTDVTSELNRSCEWNASYNDGAVEQCNMTLPNGASTWYLNPSNSRGEAMVLIEPTKPLVYTNSSTAPVNVSPSILLRQWIMAVGLNASEGGSMTDQISNDTEWIATECSVELYVRSINASVQNSVYHETTLATWSDTVRAGLYGNGGPAFHYRFPVPENASLGVGKDQNFFVSEAALLSIQNSFASLFNGTLIGYSDTLSFGTPGTVSSDILQTLFTQNFTNCPNPQDKLSCLMSNVAAAISKTFRDSALTKAKAKGFNATASDLQNRANMVVGQTMVSMTLVKVHWEWLSLPVLVWILTTITWVSTAMKTRRPNMPKWRNDVLPLLFLSQREYKFDDKSMSNEEESSTFDVNITELMSKVQNTKVRLVVGRNDAELRYSFS